MAGDNRRTLGDAIFEDIESNDYLNELYDKILSLYGGMLFNVEGNRNEEFSLMDALRFADILSKSTHKARSDIHKSLAQNIVTMLNQIYPQDDRIEYYMGSVLTNTCNYRGLNLKLPGFKDDVALDRVFNEFSKGYLTIPTEPDKQFFRSQKWVYDNLNNPSFSFSGPTSMGKSFVIRVFIKNQILNGSNENFAIIVPTKALINEVTSEITKTLKDILKEKDYRIVASAGAVILKEKHNFIFVMTPERMSSLLNIYKNIPIGYLFIDEAHKISVKDGRSAFYYDIVERLSEREHRPHFMFASPNIPNPGVYLQLIPENTGIERKAYASTYTPVSQISFLVDFIDGNVHYYNALKREQAYLCELNKDDQPLEFIADIGRGAKNLVYCHSKDNVLRFAYDFAAKRDELDDPELIALAADIRDEVHDEYYLADTVVKGVAYHMGYLPAGIRLRIEELFRNGSIDFIFCTSTLLEGVNLPADNLFVTHYDNGRRHMSEVDFKNLIGRVGRISHSLYGNVFLLRIIRNVEHQRYVDLLKSDVPEQSLSVTALLAKRQKQEIIDALRHGKTEVDKIVKTDSEYSLLRKVMNLLLRDLLLDKESRIKREFADYLTPDVINTIKSNFSDRQQALDDINVSLSQTSRLYEEISNGLHYPKLDLYGNCNYEEMAAFLEKLCEIFEWEKYEPRIAGKKKGGKHPLLRKNAVVLSRWFKGKSLQLMIQEEITNKRQTGADIYFSDRTCEPYDGSPRHNNVIIADVLNTVNDVLLFAFSNYFMSFSSEYKRFCGVESFSNDWYEFVEYGSTSPINITMQRNGFSREAATFVTENADIYVVSTEDGYRLKREILRCNKSLARREAKEVYYNIPEFFIGE